MTRFGKFFVIAALIPSASCKPPQHDVSATKAGEQGTLLEQDEIDRLLKIMGGGSRNALISDPVQLARDQGYIGSCASFGFVGLLENNLFQKTGVSVDLSERYHLLANYLHFKALGSQPGQIVRFHEVVERFGAMPESAYPYGYIDERALQFEVDSAQGLEQADAVAPIDRAIQGLDGRPLLAELERADFFGPLPRLYKSTGDKVVVRLPVMASKVRDPQRVPKYRDRTSGRAVPCFKEQSQFTVDDPDRTLASPKDFASQCLLFEPNQTHSCLGAYDLIAGKGPKTICESRASRMRFLRKYEARHTPIIANIIAALRDRQVAMIAIASPAKRAESPVWSELSHTETGSGHALLVVGYISSEQMKDPAQQEKGLLRTGAFDLFAKKIDPGYRFDTNASAERKRDVRSKSTLGQLVEKEGGIFVVRNSWSPEVGFKGHHFLTFEFLFRNFLGVVSTKTSSYRSCDNKPRHLPDWFSQDLASLFEPSLDDFCEEL